LEKTKTEDDDWRRFASDDEIARKEI